jgi:hypothetical protein
MKPEGKTMSTNFTQCIPALRAEALKLQRPLPDDALRIAARGERKDGAAVMA